MAKTVERGVLLWTRKRPRPETKENWKLTWRLATLVILAAAIVIPVGIVVLQRAPAQAHGTRMPREVEWQGDEEAPAPAARVREKRSASDNSNLVPGHEAAMPDPREFFSSLILNVCGQTAEAPPGVRIDRATLLKLRETLLSAFPNAPDEVEVLYMSDAGESGLFTLKVTDDQGREGVIGVRLIRLKRRDTPWELDSFVVIEPPH